MITTCMYWEKYVVNNNNMESQNNFTITALLWEKYVVDNNSLQSQNYFTVTACLELPFDYNGAIVTVQKGDFLLFPKLGLFFVVFIVRI